MKTTGTKGDQVFKELASKILKEGCLDKNPRPVWADGSPAHTLSINGYMAQYDASKGECPLITLRPIATKSAFGELLWIYQDQSTDLRPRQDCSTESAAEVSGCSIRRKNKVC